MLGPVNTGCVLWSEKLTFVWRQITLTLSKKCLRGFEFLEEKVNFPEGITRFVPRPGHRRAVILCVRCVPTWTNTDRGNVVELETFHKSCRI